MQEKFWGVDTRMKFCFWSGDGAAALTEFSLYSDLSLHSVVVENVDANPLSEALSPPQCTSTIHPQGRREDGRAII